MTPIAITFLLLSIGLVWGGLLASIVWLVKSSNRPAEVDASAPVSPDRP